MTAGVYVVVVLVLAIWGGSRLYQWSRLAAFPGGGHPSAEELVTAAIQPDSGPDIGDIPAQEAARTFSTGDSIHSDRTGIPAGLPPRMNILLLGTDERPDDPSPPRTDTMILVVLDLEHRSTGMISLPRDLWVPIPGYNIATKINTAYVIGENRAYPGGGSQLAKDTVSSFLGQPVEHYAQVDFNGFVHLIDLIGGIEVDVPETIHDEQYPTQDYGIELFHLDAGRQHLDGAAALKYVRTRFTDNDYKRASRQQQVIQAALDRILQADMIPTLIARAPEIMATLQESIHTDVPVPLAIDLANAIRQQSFDKPQQLVLNDAFGEETYSDEGAWILIPDRSRIRPALTQFFASLTEGSRTEPLLATTHIDGISSATEPDQRSAPAVAPDSVRLEILNGTGYPGVAARTRDLLASRGWQVVGIGDADRSDYRRTLIVDYGTADALIERINADLSLSSRVSTLTGLNHPEAVDLRIIIGQDFLKNVLGAMN